MSFKLRNGQQVSFKSPQDIERYVNENSMRRGEYDAAMREIRQQQQQVQQALQAVQIKEAQIAEQSRRYSEYDSFLNQNPAMRAALEQRGRNPTPDDLIARERAAWEEKFSEQAKQIQDLVSWREQREQREQFDSVLGDLRGEIEGMDEQSVRSRLEEFAKYEPRDFALNLGRLLASQGQPSGEPNGQQGPDKLQALVNASVEPPQPGSGSQKEPESLDFDSLDQAASEAAQQLA